MKGFRGIFASAVTGDDGRVDAGYLALFWTMFTVLNSIWIILALGGYAIAKLTDMKEAGSILLQVGGAIGACCTGSALVIGAVGAFRVGDKPRAGTASATTTTTKVETQVTASPSASAADPLPVVVSNPEPVPVVETKPKPTARRKGRK